MARVKRGTTANKRRRKILRQAKGFRWGRKSKEKLARQALMKAWTYAYRDRRTRKRDMRALWQVKINAAARANGATYSTFISALKRKGIGLNRKVLSDIAVDYPEVFKSLVENADVASEKNASPVATGQSDDE